MSALHHNNFSSIAEWKAAVEADGYTVPNDLPLALTELMTLKGKSFVEAFDFLHHEASVYVLDDKKFVYVARTRMPELARKLFFTIGEDEKSVFTDPTLKHCGFPTLLMFASYDELFDGRGRSLDERTLNTSFYIPMPETYAEDDNERRLFYIHGPSKKYNLVISYLKQPDLWVADKYDTYGTYGPKRQTARLYHKNIQQLIKHVLLSGYI